MTQEQTATHNKLLIANNVRYSYRLSIIGQLLNDTYTPRDKEKLKADVEEYLALVQTVKSTASAFG